MQRVAILGRGGAGKSRAARDLGAVTGLPVVELDPLFWRPDLTPTPAEEWARVQRVLLLEPSWIIDGDLGPYDDLEPRLAAADTVLVLDFGLARCAWRALRRGRESREFWIWLALWRFRSRPVVLQAIRRSAPAAVVRVLRRPRDLARLLDGLASAAAASFPDAGVRADRGRCSGV
jgi:hypothetical protein